MNTDMYKYQRAFSLVELIATLAIMAIVFAVASPPFQQQVQNNRTAAVAEDVLGAINFARVEALRRGSYVSVCASSNGTSCTGNWEDGMIVFADSAAADNATPSVASVLRVWSGFGDQADFSEASNKTYVRYLGSGRMATAGETFAITVKFTGCKGERTARVISVGLSGIVGIGRASCDGA